jgi:hypothetical protein
LFVGINKGILILPLLAEVCASIQSAAYLFLAMERLFRFIETIGRVLNISWQLWLPAYTTSLIAKFKQLLMIVNSHFIAHIHQHD